MIVQETNAIGTAYLRLDLLPANAQPALWETFRSYVDSRLKVYLAKERRKEAGKVVLRRNIQSVMFMTGEPPVVIWRLFSLRR